VGDTAKVGALLVTLNETKAYSSGANQEEGADTRGHYYAVADLTLENRTQNPLEASEAEFLLRDEEGYSFKKESLPEQKPPPEGQVVPGGKASGEVAFDLGTEPLQGPLRLFVSFSEQPDVRPGIFEFGVEFDEDNELQAGSDGAEKVQAKPNDTNTQPDYKVIRAPSGNLTLEVPLSWEAETGENSEKQGGRGSWSQFAGEYITASITTANSLDAWNRTGEPTSGAYAVVSRALAQRYSDYELVHSLLYKNLASSCTDGLRGDFKRPPYSGKIAIWKNCGPNDNTNIVVAAAPEGRECVVVVGGLAVSTVGREALEHILDSFEVNCGALPAPPPAEAETSASASATATATSTPTADEAQAVSCDDFVAYASGTPSQWQAQQFYDFQATPAQQAALDPDGDGFACEDASTDTDPGGTPEPSATPNPTADPTAEPSTDPTADPSAAPGVGDIDCDQVVGPIYVGPDDPHNLDGDGYACE
jgi:Domain of unknown function (DUF4352)